MAEPRPSAADRARPILRRAAVIVGVVGLLLAPLYARVLIDGRAELAHADAALELGDSDAAIRHLGRAARFRLPLAAHDDLALARLHDLARSADDPGTALAAWRELRRALIGTRVIDVRDPELLAEANAAIVELMVSEAPRGQPTHSDRWAEELEQDLEPRGRSLFAALCFVGWLGACVGFFTQGIDGKGRLNPRPALRWGGSIVVLLIGWIALM